MYEDGIWNPAERTFKEDLVDCVKAIMESFGLSREDAQDRDYWRLRIKGKTS